MEDRNRENGGRGGREDMGEQPEAGRKGGEARGKKDNPGNFANDPEKAREASRQGGEAGGRERDDE